MDWRPIETLSYGEHVLLWFPRGERGNGGMETATIYEDDPTPPFVRVDAWRRQCRF